jgi:hypothetical protein
VISHDELFLCEFTARGHTDFVLFRVYLEKIKAFAEGRADAELLKEDQCVSHSVTPLLK